VPYDASFSAGLIEALTQVASRRKPVALIAYDQPYPETACIRRARFLASFGAALVLNARDHRAMLRKVRIGAPAGRGEPTRMSIPPGGIEAGPYRPQGPLPLLEALARETEGDVVLRFPAETRLRVAVSPC